LPKKNFQSAEVGREALACPFESATDYKTAAYLSTSGFVEYSSTSVATEYSSTKSSNGAAP